MKILFCCEFYWPSQGGVQKVIQELAERLVKKGHKVDVATTKLEQRNCLSHNGVDIFEFNASGNKVYGLKGEIDKYRNFLLASNYDIVMVKAAQQWTFDAMIEIVSKLNAKKVHIPCGYSGLLNPAFSNYYQDMPTVLEQFDHLIYYASDYRDINFAKKNNLRNYSIIPNGASETEFSINPNLDIRKKLGIQSDNIVFLTVGSPPFMKGHLEALLAYDSLNLPFKSILVLNGCYPDQWNPFIVLRINPIIRLKECIKKIVKKLLNAYEPSNLNLFFKKVKTINSQKNKKVIITNLPRNELVSLFFESNIFVFASQIEYSPLVLFEACAAGLPFVSADVGNSREIADWTGGGLVYPTKIIENSYSITEPAILADYLNNVVLDKKKLADFSSLGRRAWEENFTWDTIANKYETVFLGLLK